MIQVKIQAENGIFVMSLGGVVAIFNNFAVETEELRCLAIVYQLMA